MITLIFAWIRAKYKRDEDVGLYVITILFDLFIFSIIVALLNI